MGCHTIVTRSPMSLLSRSHLQLHLWSSRRVGVALVTASLALGCGDLRREVKQSTEAASSVPTLHGMEASQGRLYMVQLTWVTVSGEATLRFSSPEGVPVPVSAVHVSLLMPVHGHGG